MLKKSFTPASIISKTLSTPSKLGKKYGSGTSAPL
jgi:hypothetical protein